MLMESSSLEGLEGLKDLVKRSCEPTGIRPTALPGLTLLNVKRADPLAAVNEPAVPEPGLCVVVQGRKYVTMGNRRYTYEPHNYSVTTVALPTTDMRFDPTQETPFLALRLALDPALLSELLLNAPPEQEQPQRASSTVFSPLVPELTSALYRLVHSLQDPHDMAVLAPQIKREITYRLLRGPQRSVLRLIVNSDSSLSQIKRAIGWIRGNYATTFRIEEVAAIACMSTSSFHQHFKRITSMSPLQYQKQLRLHEARRMLVERGADAQTAAFEVGYDSASQFSREYKRLFGAPPMQDISQLRHTSHA
jgi:AraC-like DNA-binding protein